MLYVCRRLLYSDGGFVLKLLLKKPGQQHNRLRQSFVTHDLNILRKIINEQAFNSPAVVLFILLFVVVIYI
jgi:hypothetical protein